MRIGQLGDFLSVSFKHRRKVLVVGPPGVGKTYVFRQTAEELGMDLIPTSAPLLSPVKVGGYPRPPKEEGGDATHCLFDGIALAYRATRPTLLTIDDLGMANGETLKALLDLVQFGRIDNRTLPECVVVSAASNDVTHGADVQGMIEPLKSRWHSIVKVEANVDDFMVYGLMKQFPAWLLAFVRNCDGLLTEWKPTKSLEIGFATPRGLEHLAGWDAIGVDDPEVWAGCIGAGRAKEAVAFKALQADLPDVDAVLIDPEGAPVPENPSCRYLVAMALSSRMNKGNFGQCVKYLGRMPLMFGACAIRCALSADHLAARKKLSAARRDIASSPDFQAFTFTDLGQAILKVDAKIRKSS
jgi:hypothetical protein